MSSFTTTGTQTFTLTHAKYLASKVAADLKRIQRFYGSPSDNEIIAYEEELTQYLKNGYLSKVYYGFQKDDQWIEPTLMYTSSDLSFSSQVDDDPGKIRPGANIAGAYFTSFLISNSKFRELTQAEKDSFKSGLSLKRTTGDEPGVRGYLSSDKSYSAGGKSLDRSSVKNY